ncbi:unnamed protein product [Ectocarpus sp. 12 AP-2014]
MWARLGEWSASVGSAWRHDRDLQQGTLSRVGECICPRTDCVVGLYKREKKQELRTKSSLDSGRRWAGIPRRDLRCELFWNTWSWKAGTQLLYLPPRRSLHGPEFTRSPYCNKQRMCVSGRLRCNQALDSIC